MVDVVDQKVAFAQECGFQALNSNGANFVERVKEAFGGALADVAIQGTGFSSALENCVYCIKPLGRIVLMGNPAGNTQISQKAHSMLLRKEAVISAIWNSHYGNTPINEWRYTVEMMDSGKFTCKDLISHRVSIEDVPTLVEGIRNRTISICKALYSSNA
jgi:L-iditol 2-dehydrogenase